jgi:hypothetical protein
MKGIYEQLMDIPYPPKFMTKEENKKRFNLSNKEYKRIKREFEEFYGRKM